MTAAETVAGLLKAWMEKHELSVEDAAKLLKADPTNLLSLIDKPTDEDIGALSHLLKQTGEYSATLDCKISAQVKNRSGRPTDPFSKTQDAAFIYLAFIKRGFSTRKAIELTNRITGLNGKNIEKYALDHDTQPVNDQNLVLLAEAALLKWGWDHVVGIELVNALKR